MVELLEAFAPVLFSWPVVGLLALLARGPLKSPLLQLSQGDIRKARVGTVEIERDLRKVATEGEQAVGQLQRLNQLMAGSRVLELEIIEGNFGQVFTFDQRKRMQQQTVEFHDLTEKKSRGVRRRIIGQATRDTSLPRHD